MNRIIAHITSHWYLQLTVGTLALTIGFHRFLDWLLLIVFVAVEYGLLNLLLRELPKGSAAIWCIAQLPPILLSGWVLISFVNLIPDPYRTLVLLQWWTAVWTPLIVLSPKGGYHSYYLWITALIPIMQLFAGLALIGLVKYREYQSIRIRRRPNVLIP